MRSPLDGLVVITNPFGTPGFGVFGRHAGIDYKTKVGTKFYAPAAGIVTEYYKGRDGVMVLGVRIGNYDWRFLHIQYAKVTSGEFMGGQHLGYTGDTGTLLVNGKREQVRPHLHIDVRKAGTPWDASFDNYVNPLSLLVTPKEEEMPLTEQQQDKLIKGLLGREPSAVELSDTNWKKNPGLAIDTLWEFGGKQRYADRNRIDNLTRQVSTLEREIAAERNRRAEPIVAPEQLGIEPLPTAKPGFWESVLSIFSKKQ